MFWHLDQSQPKSNIMQHSYNSNDDKTNKFTEANIYPGSDWITVTMGQEYYLIHLWSLQVIKSFARQPTQPTLNTHDWTHLSRSFPESRLSHVAVAHPMTAIKLNIQATKLPGGMFIRQW